MKNNETRSPLVIVLLSQVLLISSPLFSSVHITNTTKEPITFTCTSPAFKYAGKTFPGRTDKITVQPGGAYVEVSSGEQQFSDPVGKKTGKVYKHLDKGGAPANKTPGKGLHKFQVK